jgi:sugar-phosphatase
MTLECQAILFDLDGVLVDSAECVEGTWRCWAEVNQLDPDRVISIAHGRRTIETVKLVAPHLAADEELARLAASESTQTAGIYEIRGAREFLRSLPGPWAIVTSGIRAVASLRIKHTNLPFPPVLVCADEVTAGKPDPEGYLAAASQLGVDARQCIVVEDAPPGLEAAHRAGMRSIAVLGTYAPGELRLADTIVESVASLSAQRDNGSMLVHATPVI